MSDKKARDIGDHEGKKYLVKVTATCGPDRGKAIMVDLYDIFDAVGITCHRIAHATKKLLMAGKRGKGDLLADLWGADAALQRAIQKAEDAQPKTAPPKIKEETIREVVQAELEKAIKEEKNRPHQHLRPGPHYPRLRTRSQVLAERKKPASGCCSRYCDNMPCDCLEKALPDDAVDPKEYE